MGMEIQFEEIKAWRRMVVVIAQQCEMYLMPLNCRVKMVNFMYLYFTKTSTKTVYSLMSERFKIMWSSSED